MTRPLAHAALVLSLLLSASAAAQSRRLLERFDTDGVLVPPTSVALDAGSFSLSFNPAALALVSGGLGYLHEEGDRDFGHSRRGDGVFLNLGGLTRGARGAGAAGFSAEWQRAPDGGCSAARPCNRRLSWGGAAGSTGFAVGFARRVLDSDEDPALDRVASWDVGAIWRPTHWLSVGALGTSIDQPRRGGVALPVEVTLGTAIRPAGPAFTLAVDVAVDDRDWFDDTRLSYLASARLHPALELTGVVAHRPRGSEVVGLVGLRGWFGGGALTLAGGSEFEGPSGLAGLVAAEVLGAKGPSLLGPGRTAQALFVDEALEGPSRLSSLLGLADPLDPATRLSLRLQGLARDDSLSVLVLRLRSADSLGLARVEELRAQIAELRSRGKRVVAWLESPGDREYYLALAADRIVLVPQSILQIDGLSSNRVYLRGLLRKLGVTPQFVAAGEFKSAPEQLTRESPSDEAALVIDSVLDDQFGRYLAAIASARGLSPERVREVLDRGILTAEQAVELGFADGLVAGKDALEEDLRGFAGRSLRLRDAGPDPEVPREWGPVPTVALVEVRGNIVPGGDAGGGRFAAADRVARQIRKAVEDQSVAALVVRVESPGGDVTASEIIWDALTRARKKKPVIVSLGDVAASGGYYVAVGGDRIYAEPSTLTGSIGVFAGKVDLSELLARSGVGVARFTRGDHADLFSLLRPWSPAEQAAVEDMVNRTYESFLARVAEGRRLTREQVHEVARGRVWTGAQALERGLVDEIGGLGAAIAEARRRAGVAPDVPVAVLGASGLFDLPAAPTPPFAQWEAAARLLARLAEESAPVLPPPTLHGGRPPAVLAEAAEEFAAAALLLDGRPLAWAPGLRSPR